MTLTLALLLGTALNVGVVASQPAVARDAARELEAQGLRARVCADEALACVDDERCRPLLRARCGVDAIVGVEARSESDGDWTRTVVVDGEGAVAMSLDQPADGRALLPALAVDTLRAMPVPVPVRGAPPVVVPPAVTDERVVGDAGDAPAFWAGVVAASAGAVFAGAAATLAGVAELERAEPTRVAQSRVEAGDRARTFWIGAAAGGVVAVAGAAAACVNSGDATLAPENRRWCIE